MKKICLLPIYRRSYEQNLKERLSALNDVLQQCHSASSADLCFENINNEYRYSFNQVFGFIYVYVDNLFNLKIKKIVHNGKVFLGGKYNFKKEDLLLSVNLLNEKADNIIGLVQATVDNQKIKSKFYIDDEYLQTIALSTDFIEEIERAFKQSKGWKDKEKFAKLYILKNTCLNNQIDECLYNEFLTSQIKSKEFRFFPFVSYTDCNNPDIAKIINEDLEKYSSYFKEVSDDVRDLLQREFEDKISTYCQYMKLDIKTIESFSEVQKMKFVFCHYFNMLTQK